MVRLVDDLIVNMKTVLDTFFVDMLDWKNFEFVVEENYPGSGEGKSTKSLRIYPLDFNRDCSFHTYIDMDSETWKRSESSGYLPPYELSLREGEYSVLWIVDAIASHLEERITGYFDTLEKQKWDDSSRENLSFEFSIWLTTARSLSMFALDRYNSITGFGDQAKARAKIFLGPHVDSFWRWMELYEEDQERYPLFFHQVVIEKAERTMEHFREAGFPDRYELDPFQIIQQSAENLANDAIDEVASRGTNEKSPPFEAELLKNEFQKLCDEVGIGFIEFAAPGSSSGEETGFVSASFDVTNQVREAHLLLDLQDGFWMISPEHFIAGFGGRMSSIEKTGEVFSWFLSFIQSTYAQEIYRHVTELEEDGDSGRDTGILDGLISRWLTLARLQISMATGGVDIGLAVPREQVVRQARHEVGFQSFLPFIDWFSSDLQKRLTEADLASSFVALKDELIELGFWDKDQWEEWKEEWKERIENEIVRLRNKDKADQAIPQTFTKPPSSPEFEYQKSGLSVNAIAWIVALAIGAFIAVGAALGY